MGCISIYLNQLQFLFSMFYSSQDIGVLPPWSSLSPSIILCDFKRLFFFNFLFLIVHCQYKKFNRVSGILLKQQPKWTKIEDNILSIGENSKPNIWLLGQSKHYKLLPNISLLFSEYQQIVLPCLLKLGIVNRFCWPMQSE